MEVERKATTSTATNNRTTLELLRDIEGSLRRPTVAVIIRFSPPNIRQKLPAASVFAEEFMQDLAKINIKDINDFELQPARIYIGLTFVGFGALMMVILLLYINTFNPHINYLEQINKYWYQYILCVCLGVTGMFLIAREVIRYHR
ncbi:hypothetical protein WJM97_05450 [Okeanomitos corallinicola TIOX110]|uniref:Transmembrane protein n=1 Tax=Okeanomitos corallinicola TIOX110 TaxID=3133117 RepID=A0ABZ2UZY7_9CYAN